MLVLEQYPTALNTHARMYYVRPTPIVDGDPVHPMGTPDLTPDSDLPWEKLAVTDDTPSGYTNAHTREPVCFVNLFNVCSAMTASSVAELVFQCGIAQRTQNWFYKSIMGERFLDLPAGRFTARAKKRDEIEVFVGTAACQTIELHTVQYYRLHEKRNLTYLLATLLGDSEFYSQYMLAMSNLLSAASYWPALPAGLAPMVATPRERISLETPDYAHTTYQHEPGALWVWKGCGA